jgi:hypothetical protein
MRKRSLAAGSLFALICLGRDAEQTAGARSCGSSSSVAAVPGNRLTKSDRRDEVTAPIATSTDGLSTPIVWYMDDGLLKGIDGDTGATVFGGCSGNYSGARRWSPIAVKGRIIAGGAVHLCSWSPQ